MDEFDGKCEEMQKLVFGLTKDNISDVWDGVCHSSLMNSNHGLKVIISSFFYFVNSNPQKRAHLLELSKLFCASENKSIFISALIHQIFAPNSYPQSISLYWLLYSLTESGLFDISSLDVAITSDNYKQLIALFIWLAPEVSSVLPKLSSDIIGLVNEHKQELPKSICSFFDNLPSLQENDWKKYLSYRKGKLSPSPLLRIIQRDDIQKFVEYASKPTFDPNTKLLPNHFEPNFIIQNYPPLICVAAFYNSQQIFDFLLHHGANVNMTDSKGRNLANFISAGGCSSLFNSRISTYANSLPFAAYFNREETFHWLIDNQKYDENDIKECFLKSAITNNVQIMNYCINEFHVDTNCVNENGSNVLHLAATSNNQTIIMFLLSHGLCNPNLVNKNGVTPLLLSILRGNKEAVIGLISYPSTDIEYADEDGNTPLILATKERNAEIVDILLEKGASPNAANRNGITALHYAVIVGDSSLVRLLIECQAININCQDNDGWTPLHYAAQFDLHDIINILLSNAQTNKRIKSSNGKTPFDIAVSEDRLDILDLLQ